TRYPYRKVGMDHLLSTEYHHERTKQGRINLLFSFEGMLPPILHGSMHLENWIRKKAKNCEGYKCKRTGTDAISPE
ncbi:hypothetical protein, partial [Salinithrix halophila]